MSELSIANFTHIELSLFAFKRSTASFMKYPNRIKEIRDERGLSQEQLADRLNTSRGQVYQLEKGLRKLSHDWMVRLSKALHCDPEDFIKNSTNKIIPILGYIGAGEEVFPVDDLPLISSALRENDVSQINCEFVETPPGSSSSGMVALRVKGDSMEPFLSENTIIYYNAVIRRNFDEYLNSLVVAKLKDGHVYLKKLKRGFGYGKYNLLSYNAKMIENVEMEWCAKIVFVKMV